MEFRIGKGAEVSEVEGLVELPVPSAMELRAFPVPVGPAERVELRVGKGARPMDAVRVAPTLPEPDTAGPVGLVMVVPLVIGKGAEVLPPIGSTLLTPVPEIEEIPEVLVVELFGGKGRETGGTPVVNVGTPVPDEEITLGDVPVGPDVDVLLVKEKVVR